MASDRLPEIHNTTDQQLPVTPLQLQQLRNAVEQQEGVSFTLLELVLVDEQSILEVNSTYLGHDYVTDIITFRYDEPAGERTRIEATLYCCLPRIIEQAESWAVTPDNEFLRVFTHGLLHLCGYEDGTEDQKQQMRELENKYLAELKRPRTH